MERLGAKSAGSAFASHTAEASLSWPALCPLVRRTARPCRPAPCATTTELSTRPTNAGLQPRAGRQRTDGPLQPRHALRPQTVDLQRRSNLQPPPRVSRSAQPLATPQPCRGCSSTTSLRLVPNARHERRLQAQLEDVRSMEGLGTILARRPLTQRADFKYERLHDIAPNAAFTALAN